MSGGYVIIVISWFRCGLWILLVRSCTVCLVPCLCLDSLWRGFLPRLTWTPLPTLPHRVLFAFFVIILFVLFVFIFCHDVLGSTLPTTRSTRAWFWTICCYVCCVFRLFCCVCHRFAASSLMSNTWYRWPVTRVTFHISFYGSRCMSLHEKSLHICYMESLASCSHGLFPKPWFTHSCFGFGLNLNRGVHKNNVLRKSHGLHKKASKSCFTQKPCYAMLCTKNIFTQKLYSS